MATRPKSGLAMMAAAAAPEPEMEPEEMETMAESAEVRFKVPSTYQLPEGKMPGDTWDFTASGRIEEDGTVTMVSMDGVPLNEPEAEDEEMEEVEVEETETAGPPKTLQEAVAAQRAAGLPTM